MSFHFTAGASTAIKVLPVLAATMVFSLLPPAQSAAAGGITGGLVNTSGMMAPPPPGPIAYPDLTVTITKDVYPNYCFGLFDICYAGSNRVLLHTTVWNIGMGPSGAAQVDVNGRRWSVPALAPGG